MILFQKIYKILFILWSVLFCSTVFSNPFMFNPMLFAPHPLPSQVILPQNTPFTPLCPPNVPIQLCLSMTSFPLVEANPNAVPSTTMFTPFSHKTQDISSNRRKRLLSRYKWKSYEYLNEDNKLRYLPETERDVVPETDYYRVHIQETTDNNSPVQVIQETRTNGQQQNHIGELRGVQTEEILNIIENVSPQPAPETAPKQPSTTPPQTPSQPEAKTQGEKDPATQRRKEPQPAQRAIIINTPVPTIALNYNNIPTQCSDLRSGNTEAISICVDCAQRTNDQLQRDSAETLRNANLNTSFNAYVFTKLKGKICHGRNIAEPIKEHFERTCGNISFDNYISDVLICESCKNKVPPALMLSMMSLESSGACHTTGDDGDSHGLFQINISYHKDPPICSTQQKAKLQTASLAELKTGLQCLGNPVANIRKSIEILKGSYRSVNGSHSDFNCQSPSTNTHQTNQWRKALAGYNGGPKHIDRLKQMPRPQAIPERRWNQMDEWEKIRVQYFFYKRVNPAIRMSNLAHTETALGSSGDSQSQLNLFNSWEQTLGNQNNLDQCRM